MRKIARFAAPALTISLVVLASSVPVRAQTANGAAWPQLLGDPGHSSYSSDPAVSTGNASTLGVKWMANLYSTDLGSPVVAYNAALGKTVVYVGNQRADVFAVDAATGRELWSTNLGIDDKIEDTPMVAPDGSVWVGTSYNPTMYKLDGATGAVDCSIKAALPINASPMYVVPAGGIPTVFWAYIDSNATQGPIIASNESNCAQIFSFSKYLTHAGSWTTPAYGTSASGEPLIVVGTADTDSTEYAIDANTGALVWDFGILNPPPGFFDIGDGATISAPGNNGFANGVAYFDTKYGTEYALDLSTGTDIWQYQMSKTDGIASNALDGNALVVGYPGGLYSFNATSGTVNWQYSTPAGVDSSPAIAGPTGSEVVAFADLTGAFRVVALSTGAQLYRAQTGAYVTASPAEANGTFFLSSADGFLYAYTPGGGNASPPASAITSPTNLSQIPNPNGNVTISGTATDASGVTAVEVAIQNNGTSGPWYNSASNAYNVAPVRNQASLASPGATSTTWSIALPAPPSGGNFTIYASAVNTANIVNKATASSFSISPSKGEPNIKLSAPAAAPGASFTASSTGFAAGESVVFTFLGKVVATATAGANGHVPTTKIKVPTNATFGPTSLTLTGQTSGRTTSATVDVTNNWTQFGHDPGRTDAEPHDPVIAASLSIGQNTVLNQSWYYPAQAPVNTSPAVEDGVAYFGNDAGVLTALIVNAGSPQWTYVTPSGAPIHSSPAVDSNKTILFGSTDGNLYAVSPSGSLVRSLSLGGNVGSPAADNGSIFVGSDNHSLYAINDATGTIVWTDALGGGVHSAPAYDAKANLVIVGDDSGAVTAVNSTTGTQVWRATTGGAVTAAPLITGGKVFVGSTDGNFYSFSETSGAVAWKYAAAGPIGIGASLYTPNVISFGTQNGVEYNISTSGALVYQLSVPFHGNAIAGIGNVEGNTLVELANGTVLMIRTNNGPFIAWTYKTGSTLATSPVIVDGTVYVGAADGGLYAFTPQGANPLNKPKHPLILITNTASWMCATRP